MFGGTHTAKNTFGIMTIPKNSILYHVSEEEFILNPEKPMLFLTFHPSDYPHFTYVTQIKLTRDINVLFMVDPYNKMGIKLFPLLNKLIKTGNNLSKQLDTNLRCYVKQLQKDELDGWFSTIEGSHPVEVALINDSTLYEIINIEEYKNNMIEAYTTYNNTEQSVTIPTNWGTAYPISTIENPLSLYINSKYAELIHEIELFTEKNGIFFPIQVILQNANISYFEKEIPKITWEC